jgi:hypothetical protein
MWQAKFKAASVDSPIHRISNRKIGIIGRRAQSAANGFPQRSSRAIIAAT